MRINNKLIAVVVCLILVMSPLTVLAAGTSSVAISTENPAVGDTFTVTATATESGNMTVKYNENVLSVVSCNASGYKSSAGEVDFTGKQGTITFKANAAGQSAIAVSSSNASSSSMVVNVGAANAAPAGASEDFDINGKKYTVSERFGPEEIPNGYSQVQLTINGKSLKGISNGQTTMVYLKPVDNVGGPGTFYVYDSATNSIKDNFYLGRPDYYVVPGEPGEMLSENLTKGSIDVDGRQVEVYTMQGVDGFVYVYGTSSTNVTGWFQYDVSEKTVQRVNEAVFTVGSTNAKTDSKPGILDTLKSINMRYIIAGIIFVVIVVVAIIINIALKKRDDKADLIDGDEIDEDGVEDKNNTSEVNTDDELDPKEQKRLLKEQKKREKEERKAAKKEAKRRKKEELFDEYENAPTIEDEIQEEFGDFDIDKSIDELKADKVPKVEDIIREDSKDKDIDITPRDIKSKASEEAVEEEGAAFWEDEKDIKKAQRKAKKESKKRKNVFGDEELDIENDIHSKHGKKNAKPNGSTSDIIDFNDL